MQYSHRHAQAMLVCQNPGGAWLFYSAGLFIKHFRKEVSIIPCISHLD